MVAPGSGWIIGRAAVTGREFYNRASNAQRWECFLPGCFHDAPARTAALCVDHAGCRCVERHGGAVPPPELDAGLLDPAFALSSTSDGTLRLFTSQAGGLFFAAWFRLDACWHDGIGKVFNIHQAIEAGHCHGMSVHGHGGERVTSLSSAAPGVWRWRHLRLQEISLCFREPPGSPDTWVAPASWATFERQMQELEGR